MSTSTKKVEREKPIPEEKKEIVKEITDKISSVRTVLVASCKGLPGKQFHEIKKKLRGKAEIRTARKSAINRAIDGIEKGAVKNLKKQIGADVVLFFSEMDPFELSALLTENQSPSKAKSGDIALEDIKIEAGPTDLIPGPAISELGSAGLKVAVKEGKLEIMKGLTVAKKGEEIKKKAANVLGKLGITPMKVGFIPLAAYDSKEDKIYVDIVIDKKATLEALRDMLGKSLGFAVNVNYPTKETINYFISKAASEEKALEKIIGKKADKPVEENKESTEGAPSEKPEAQEKTESNEETSTEGSTDKEEEEKSDSDKDTKEDA